MNNAGVNFNLGSDNSVEHAEEVMSTNYFGTKRMVESMVPLMKSSAFGARIVNVSSRLGRLNGRRNVSFLNQVFGVKFFCLVIFILPNLYLLIFIFDALIFIFVCFNWSFLF